MKKELTKVGLILLILTILLWSTACAPISSRYKTVVSSWLGKDINRLITSWGPPSDVFEMPNGNKMYTWLYTGGTLITTNYNYYLRQATSSANRKWCKTTFTTNVSDQITNWRIEGNACR